MFFRRTGSSWGGRVDGYCDRLSPVSIWSLQSQRSLRKKNSAIIWKPLSSDRSDNNRWDRTDITGMSAVVWSSLLISVTWVELLWAVYTFFRINNIDLKCSFVRCRKYHKSWWNGAAELHISVDLLCGTTAAELHNSVDLLCGTTAAETFERWTFWKIQQTQIDSRPSANSWNMYALRRFSKLLKDERFTKTE